MSGEAAKSFYEDFLAELRKQHSPDKIKDGVFGEYMQVLCIKPWILEQSL